MPNRKKTVLPAKVVGKTMLSHKTAIINSALKIPLQGTKDEVLKELSSIIRIQLAFVFQAIQDNMATSDNEDVENAIGMYYEASTLFHYTLNDIKY